MGRFKVLEGRQLYKRVARPVLFRLPPELTHSAMAWLLRRFVARRTLQALSSSYDIQDPRLRVDIAGLTFPSPVGLAAGFDKNCEILPAMMHLGFGYVVGGTVMYAARAGNPSPRLVRLTRERSLINSMGFPSKGMMRVRRNLRRLGNLSRPLVVSVSGLTLSELVACHAAIEPLADAVELNISSPNTNALRTYQDPAVFADILEQVNDSRSRPLFVKLPAYSDPKGRELVLSLVGIARERGVDAITVPNTTPVAAPMLATGKGGLSGRAVFEDTLRIVKEARSEAGRDMAINTSGGIFSAEDAYRALEAGADTVQLFTALIYEGPGVVANINRGLLRLLEESGVPSVAHLTRPAVAPRPAEAPASSLTEATTPS